MSRSSYQDRRDHQDNRGQRALWASKDVTVPKVFQVNVGIRVEVSLVRRGHRDQLENLVCGDIRVLVALLESRVFVDCKGLVVKKVRVSEVRWDLKDSEEKWAHVGLAAFKG